MMLYQLFLVAFAGVALAGNLRLDRGPDGLHGHWSASRLVGSLGGLPLAFGEPQKVAPKLNSKGKEDQCCLPDAFELFKYETQAMIAGGRTTYVRVEQHASLDKVHQKAAINQSQWNGSGPRLDLSIIFDIAKKTVYFLNAARTCSVAHQVPTMTWNSCLPPGSELVSTMQLGAGSSEAGLLADVWEVPIQSGPFEGQRAHMVATPKDCTPISESFAGRTNDDKVAGYEFGGIFNFTLGIKDAKVFDVPPPCELRQLPFKNAPKGGKATGVPRAWWRSKNVPRKGKNTAI